jgi:PRTRC genetic system protein A
VRGLVDCNPVLKMAYPKVPAELLREVLESSLAAKDPQGKPLEILFYLIWNEGWELKIPAQKQTATSCQPLDSADPAYLASVIELHSHNGMEAFFSRQDDLDETGFKIYAVLGDIYRAPKLSVRVGLQGYFWQLPAEEIFNLPDIIQDGAKG